MMSTFVANNKEELVKRCTAKVATRTKREATTAQMHSGIPLFIEQLQMTLEAEEQNHPGESLRISGPSGGGTAVVFEMGVTAAAHGTQLLELGFTVDQVVHDYGDLCQAITDLAVDRDAPFAITEFRTLNRCLDNAIASAAEAFIAARDKSVAAKHESELAEGADAFMHSLRSSLSTVTYAVAALQLGNLPLTGSTGTVLKRGLAAMRKQIGGPTLDELLTPAPPLT